MSRHIDIGMLVGEARLVALTRDIGIFLGRMAREEIRPPPDALATVRTGFTDCLAVLVAGWDEPSVRVVCRTAGLPDAASWEAALRLSPPAAGLVLGTAAHVLDYDDTGLNGHPSAVLVPAVLAEAQATGAGGAAMAAAYVAGYEIWASLIERDPDLHHIKGWHPSAVFGAMAATAAAAVLRGLDAATASHAIGIAASLAGGLTANFGSMTKSFQLGRAIASGLEAVRYAQAGLTSAADAIEHECGFLRAFSPRGAADTASPIRLGESWRILRSGVNIKLWPMCYAAHRLIDATIGLCRAHPLAPEAVASIEVELGVAQARMLREHAPRTPLEAKFSAEFAVAAAIVAGACGTAQLTAEFLARPALRELFAKLRIGVREGANPDEPTLSPADRVRLVLRDGTVLDSGPVALPPGHFRRPATAAALREKFDDCTAGRLSPAAASRLFEACQRIERLGGVADLLAAPAEAAKAA
jgi:2-methylcitrate dehydratase PrpD